MNVFASVIHFIVKHRWFVLIVFVLVIGFFATQLKDLRIDNSITVWFIEDDPALDSYNKFRKEFGIDEIMEFSPHQVEDLIVKMQCEFDFIGIFY